MLNSLHTLTLTDSLHSPIIIGCFNTRAAACHARSVIRAYLEREPQEYSDFGSVIRNLSSAAMNLLDECAAAIDKNPAHYVNLHVTNADDLSDPITTTYTIYYETVTGDRHFTPINATASLVADVIVRHTVPHCTVITVTTPGDLIETVGYTEVKPEMLDTLALHQPKPTADSLAEFAKLAESGTITRSQFETFARCAVNSPLPNENPADLKATADTLRKSLDAGTAILL